MSQSTSSHTAPLAPTFQGRIETTVDAIILIEACLQGRIAHVPRRPHEREREGLIKSGNVFVYEEHASGIKRWTDGVPWSPSRILGNFLLYRELEGPFAPGERKRALKKNRDPSRASGISKPVASSAGALTPYAPGLSSISGSGSGSGRPEETVTDQDYERSLIGSLTDSYEFKCGGLIKKTISLTFNQVQHHLVSYYSIEDARGGQLATPSMHPFLRDIAPRADLVLSQNLRTPVEGLEYTSAGAVFLRMPTGRYVQLQEEQVPVPVHVESGHELVYGQGVTFGQWPPATMPSQMAYMPFVPQAGYYNLGTNYVPSSAGQFPPPDPGQGGQNGSAY